MLNFMSSAATISNSADTMIGDKKLWVNRNCLNIFNYSKLHINYQILYTYSAIDKKHLHLLAYSYEQRCFNFENVHLNHLTNEIIKSGSNVNFERIDINYFKYRKKPNTFRFGCPKLNMPQTVY